MSNRIHLLRIARHLGIHRCTVSCGSKPALPNCPPPVLDEIKEAEVDELLTFVRIKIRMRTSSGG